MMPGTKPGMNPRTARTMLILVCGLPGTGKTTVAERIAEKTRSRLLSTDVMRKEIIERPGYTEKEKEMVYGLVFGMAERMLRDSKNVVLDGTFYKKGLRDSVREIAEKTGSDFHLVEVVCGERIIKERLGDRKKARSASDADFGVYKKIKRVFEPVRGEHFVINTSTKNWRKQTDEMARKF
jgi:hypothetical protein